MKRDRFVARQAGEQGGTISTPSFILGAEALTLNVDAQQGEVRVQITTDAGEMIPGFRFQDCQSTTSDSLDAKVKWERPLSMLKGRPVRLEFSLRNARLFAFETK